VDVTPPVMEYVANGVTLPEVTVQAYADSLFLMFHAVDK
jgi:hypothetical protein